MLRFLSIRNFALIERLELEFGEGLNLITGETGSGKSILVDAVGLLVGQRASSELIRSGCERARVQGIFELAPREPLRGMLEEAGIELDSDQLIVRREVSRSGANKVFLNETLSTQGLLARVGPRLADIHGQHDQQVLLTPAAHLDFLDRFGGHLELRGEVAAAARELRSVAGEIEAIEAGERERLRQIDHLQFQLRDIEKLKLVPGLDEELERERRLLGSAEKRHEGARGASELLYEEEVSAVALLKRAERALEQLSRHDPEHEATARRLAGARIEVEELAFELREYADAIAFDPARLDAVQARLAEIQLARRKYGDSVEAILEHFGRCQAELQELAAQETRLQDLEARREESGRRYAQLAESLSRARREAAGSLGRRVEAELEQLAMGGTRFEVEFSTTDDPVSEKGAERAQFLLSANPGEPPRPLARIASGGELSRILLALETIFGGDEQSRTLVFDEIDAGIGGRVASVLGEKLSRLAGEHQVFCVTHLPQIAAAAARHFHVSKQRQGKRTLIRLELLDEKAREQELARMLAGKDVTSTTLRQAREMLQTAS